MKIAVYYRKDPMFRLDKKLTQKDVLDQTKFALVKYTNVASVMNKQDALEHTFAEMQAERWSIHGEARDLIQALGLSHTSMSVGDVLMDRETGEMWQVDSYGFAPVPASC